MTGYLKDLKRALLVFSIALKDNLESYGVLWKYKLFNRVLVQNLLEIHK